MTSEPGKSDDGSASAVIAGAAVVGGVAATGLAAAGGVAYAATRSDKVGDAAKATGAAAIAVGTKAQQLDREHQITNRAVEATKGAVGAASSLNAKYDISGKASETITWMANGITKAMGSKSQPPNPSQRG